VRRALRAQKAGHTGTLDPLASGLLPICLGEATKLAQFLLDATKAYVATVRFGVRTDTLDAEGRVVSHAPVDVTEPALRAALQRFVGPMLQRPPAHSALKHAGRPLYEYARAGQEVPREPRPVEIFALDLHSWAPPDAVIAVTCSKGTYVRVLAADLGDALECGAHLAGLRRTATGGFDVRDAVALDRLEAMAPAERDACLRPTHELIAHLPQVVLDAASAQRFAQGQAVAAPGTLPGLHAVLGPAGLAGVGEARDGLVQPRRVLVPDPGDGGQAG
jgi:tRNA pseudouridine55 synthase